MPENELENPIDLGTKLVDLLSGRSYYEVTNIYVSEDLDIQVRLQEYWNNTDSMVERKAILVTLDDITERLENDEIAFM